MSNPAPVKRLHNGLLEALPAAVQLPSYDRHNLQPGIVHLGVGAFHRAHQAWYTEQLLNRSGGDWGIIGASMRSADVAQQLNPQDGLYTLIEKSEANRFQVIGCLQRVIVAPQEPDELVQAIASSSTRVVTLTITEKGYCHDPASGELLQNHPAIEAEVADGLATPRTAIGFLVAGLRRRREQGLPGITLLSCDNLPHNGRVLGAVVTALAARLDGDLAEWIARQVTFPCSMVDRIVPASTAADRQLAEEALGVSDEGAVSTEPFSQWVIENNFATTAPDWGSVGALLVEDVTPFEMIKLRLLNGSHSLIAYLGYVAGYDYVHEVVSNGAMLALVRAYMQSVLPTLTVPADFDIEEYQEQLLQRFANPALQHRTAQIAMDGSQKIPQRWLQSLRQLLDSGQDSTLLALAIAGWVKFLGGQRDNRETFVVDDPLAVDLQARLEVTGGNVALVRTVMEQRQVFGDLAAQDPALLEQVTAFYTRLCNEGNQSVINALVASLPAAEV
ncbi:mannitol dehydrogenase family protein [Pseudomaricurvus sp. HS19]|uniref:mannitol dehydrogenase family protein n=1 Tax=Pseudomaricurvus sp. HS19 TaxID=2692626 RepID=UPI001370C3E9|nr:mannitol dehydrogenase family protein [Pseudomaricurvus sp. HS19]MYM62801.1 mannitol dehydrogenase family protein [Pseudomaricurvus sp. HS19]